MKGLGFWLLTVSFALLVLGVLILVIYLVDVHATATNISSLTHAERKRFYAQRLRFYHISPSQKDWLDVNDSEDRFSSMRELSESIEHSLRREQHFSYFFRGYTIANGLPPHLARNGVVVVHVHGSWGGIWPAWPALNRLTLGTHGLPILDAVSRFVPTRLPLTVISFVMPTEALATINFGQHDDSLCVALALHSVIRRLNGSEIKIVLTGDCLGALRVERFLRSPFCTQTIVERLSGILLASPIPNLHRVIRHQFFHRFALPILTPNFVPSNDIDIGDLAYHRCAIDKIPTVISLLEDDILCGKGDVSSIHQRFANAEILIVPRGSLNAKGMPIVHGTTFGWPPVQVSLALLCNNTSLKTPLGYKMSKERRITVVTALYDIGREDRSKGGDGRAFAQYKEWFRDTLLLPVPMVVFVDDSLQDWVKDIRPIGKFETVVIGEPLTKCPRYSDLNRIANILQGHRGQSFQGNRNDLSMRMAEYMMVIYSKFGWLQRSIKMNPFDTDVFAWVDAGQSRFWPHSYRKQIKGGSLSTWPHSSWTRKFATSQRFWLQGRRELFPYVDIETSNNYEKLEELERRYVGTCESILWASVMAGNKSVVQRVCSAVHEYLESSLLKRGRIDTEQVALQMLWFKHRDWFQFIIPIHWSNLFGTDQYPELVPICTQPTLHLSETSYIVP